MWVTALKEDRPDGFVDVHVLEVHKAFRQQSNINYANILYIHPCKEQCKHEWEKKISMYFTGWREADGGWLS